MGFLREKIIGNKKVLVALIIILGLGLSAAGYFVYKKWIAKPQTTVTETTTPAPSATETTDKSAEILAKFNEYENKIEENWKTIEGFKNNPPKEVPAIVGETKNLLEEFKKFIQDNKETLEKKGINTIDELAKIEERLSMVDKYSSTAGPTSTQTPTQISTLSLSLPFDSNNYLSTEWGIWPFCVHGGDHPEGHGGIDFELREGTEIKAAASGTVEEVMEESGGTNVMITNGSYALGYIPLSNPQVEKGDKITAGQVLGTTSKDETGRSYFVHFEVVNFQKNQRVCPYNYFSSSAKSVFDEMFKSAHYPEQGSEPSICNCESVAAPSR